MRFSVVTAGFRQSQWLNLCVASVAGQGVDDERIVRAARSDNGALDWHLTCRRVKAFAEKDGGAFFRSNRKIKPASGSGANALTRPHVSIYSPPQ